MLINYLKVAVRNLLRSKTYSFLNIFGLSVGMSCCILIYLYIQDERAYDRYHRNADRIYRVTRDFLSQDGSVSLHLGHVAPPFGPLLQNDFGEIEAVVRMLERNLSLSVEKEGQEAKQINQERIFMVEPSFSKIFDLKMIKGDAVQSLEAPRSVILSEAAAAKFFGEEDPIGKQLKAPGLFDLNVTGVFESFPDQSHFHPEMMIAFSTLEDSAVYGRQRLETSFGNNAFATYFLAGDGFDQAKMEAAFPAFLDKHMANRDNPDAPKPSSWTRLYIQPMLDIHLHSHLDSELEENGNINNLYVLGIIGLFIILIAGINFMNLSTARAARRAKEVGVRKAAGAHRWQLIGQFLSESVVLSLLALVLALAISFVALQWLNAFTDKQLAIALAQNWQQLLLLMAFAIGVGLLSGLYPAFFLSGFVPAVVLKSQVVKGEGSTLLRRVLVVSQFTISVTLIISTYLIYKQIQFVNQKELGLDKDHVITTGYYGELNQQYDAFYQKLTESPYIVGVSRSSRAPSERLLDSQGAMIQKGDTLVPTDVVIKNLSVDDGFANTYNIPIVAGRNFSKEVVTDDTTAFLLNEAAVRMIGWANNLEAVGKEMNYGRQNGTVIGVLKDFHFESLHQEIVPMIFHIGRQPFYFELSLRLDAKNHQAALGEDDENKEESQNLQPEEVFSRE